jgi:hypothetical protein
LVSQEAGGKLRKNYVVKEKLGLEMISVLEKPLTD